MQIPTIIPLMKRDGSSRNSDNTKAFFDRCFFLSSIDNLFRETKPTSTPAKNPPKRKAMIIPINNRVPMFTKIDDTMSAFADEV